MEKELLTTITSEEYKDMILSMQTARSEIFITKLHIKELLDRGILVNNRLYFNNCDIEAFLIKALGEDVVAEYIEELRRKDEDNE